MCRLLQCADFYTSNRLHSCTLLYCNTQKERIGTPHCRYCSKVQAFVPADGAEHETRRAEAAQQEAVEMQLHSEAEIDRLRHELWAAEARRAGAQEEQDSGR